MRIILLLLIATSLNCFSQTVDGFPIKNIGSDYIKISVRMTAMGNFATKIDYGQGQKWQKKKQTEIKDENGKRMKFTSPMGVVNFFSKLGYELVDFEQLNTINDNYIMHRINNTKQYKDTRSLKAEI